MALSCLVSGVSMQRLQQLCKCGPITATEIVRTH